MKLLLSNLKLSELTQLGQKVRGLADDASTVEGVAQAVARLFYDVLRDDEGGPACVLSRFYTTVAFHQLPPDLQAFASEAAGTELGPDVRCLTLLGTAGDQPAWNDRKTSAGHQAIPLPSEQAVGAIPMISQLIAQLGLPVAAVVQPDANLVLELEQRTYNVFFVEDALGSPYIPAQDFVSSHGVRSVVGFGGLLPDGAIYCSLLFTRIPFARSTANALRNLALNLKLAVLPHIEEVFQSA